MANLSRQYRPKKFQDIYGQGNIIETLRKEVEQNKLGHAYLFSGPRGVGKTTAARIFAKAVNCLAPMQGEPCLECEACKKMSLGGCIDIIEMDAASHTGVDNVREAIVEHVRFVPVELKYKVYIVDEAHMLSNSAWNALLKTIEEPPEHAIFIFATTEKHKVPATIVSRCQRFDFKKVSREHIVERLKELAANEDCQVDEVVLKNVAVKSEGCLRDAENILGQLLSLGEKNITSDIASLIIPASNLPHALGLLAVSSGRDVKSALQEVQRLEDEGIALMPLFDDLLTTARELMIFKASDKTDILDSGVESLKTIQDVCRVFSHQELINISLLLMERRKDAKQGLDPRFALEMAVVAVAVGAAGESSSKDQVPAGPVTAPELKELDFEVSEAVNKPAELSEPATPKDLSELPVQPAVVDRPPAASQSNTSKQGLSLDEVIKIWSKLLQSLEDHKSLVFILKLCRPRSVEGEKIILEFQYPYHQQTILQNQKNKLLIENFLRKLSGLPSLSIDGLVNSTADSTEPGKKDMASNLINAFGGRLVS